MGKNGETVLGSCEQQIALNQIKDVLPTVDSDDKSADGTVELVIPEMLFVPAQFGCEGEPCLDTDPIYGCFADPPATAKRIKEIGLKVLDLAVEDGVPPIHFQITGHFFDPIKPDEEVNDANQAKIKCRAEHVKRAIVKEAKDAYLDDQQENEDDSIFPKFDWICSSAAKMPSSEAKTTAKVGPSETGICQSA